MVRPRDAMETVARTVARSGELPADMSLLLEEADAESDNADVSLPLLEIQPNSVENVVVDNTDFSGFVTDDAGNHTGRIYLADFEMSIEIGIWTAANDSYSPDELGENLRDALYPHSSYGPQQPFLDEDGNEVDQITHFRIDEGNRVDDLLQSPSVRRWTQDVELWGCEEFRTDDDYIATVDYPSDGELNDTDDDGVIDSK